MIAVERGERDPRFHESSRTPGRFFPVRVKQPRLSDKHSALAAHPSSLCSHCPAADRPGEEQVKTGRQQEAIGHQAVRRVKSRIVEHLEIAGAVHSARGVKIAFVEFNRNPRNAAVDNF